MRKVRGLENLRPLPLLLHSERDAGVVECVLFLVEKGWNRCWLVAGARNPLNLEFSWAAA